MGYFFAERARIARPAWGYGAQLCVMHADCADPYLNGARVVATVRDFADIQALNYTYDSFEPVPPPLPPPPVAVAAAAIGPVAGAGAVTLGAAPTRVELTSPAAAMAVPGQ